jgi:hypothetical protein
VCDLVEFLHDVLQVREFPWAKFNHKVVFHTSCSAMRGLGLASMSERVHDAKFSKPRKPLERWTWSSAVAKPMAMFKNRVGSNGCPWSPLKNPIQGLTTRVLQYEKRPPFVTS